VPALPSVLLFFFFFTQSSRRHGSYVSGLLFQALEWPSDVPCSPRFFPVDLRLARPNQECACPPVFFFLSCTFPHLSACGIWCPGGSVWVQTAGESVCAVFAPPPPTFPGHIPLFFPAGLFHDGLRLLDCMGFECLLISIKRPSLWIPLLYDLSIGGRVSRLFFLKLAAASPKF